MAVPSKQISSNDLDREKTDTARERIWPYLVLVSCYLSYVVSTGFNFGVVGSITEAQKIKFNATLDQSSWTGSVHTAVFLSTGKKHDYRAVEKEFQNTVCCLQSLAKLYRRTPYIIFSNQYSSFQQFKGGKKDLRCILWVKKQIVYINRQCY